VKVTWLGHSAFKIDVANRIVFVDPWLGNPLSPIKADSVKDVDIVYVTHDHHDHLGEAFDICKRTKANFVATAELAQFAKENGVSNVDGLNIGGNIDLKGVKLSVVQATHTSSRGAPTGVVIQGEGETVYHAGDTGLFGDMKIIGEMYRPDLAMIPMGGYYTMDAKEAAEAVKLIRPKIVIPMHYKTMPVLAQSADEFVNLVKQKMPEVKTIVMKPGETYEL
jgi:L-ascorbate metabolism protein UlaG (beta-lactamase superfamily)